MNNEITHIIEIANDFLKVPSSIGYEKPFLNYLNNKISGLGYATELKDTYLIVKNKNAKNLFSTHIDRHALIQNEDGEIEYLAFHEKKKYKTPFKREQIQESENELAEQLNKDNYHASITDKFITIKKDKINLRFIREGGPEFFQNVATRYVNCETYSYNENTGIMLNKFKIERYESNHQIPTITFHLNPIPRKNDKIFSMVSQIKVFHHEFYGQLDNVISAAVLYYFLETTKFKDEIIFTTKEEVSKSYLCVTDYINSINYNPKLIVLDTSPYENFNGYKEGFLVLRKGDEHSLFDKKTTDEIENIVKENNIPFTYKPTDLGITELGRVANETQGRINGTTIQIPTKNYHTTYETSTLKCLENYYKIIKQLSKQ